MNKNATSDPSSNNESEVIHSQNDDSVAEWAQVPRRSNMLDNLSRDVNVGDTILVFIDNNHYEDQDDNFQGVAVCEDEETDDSNMKMSSFKRKHNGGMKLFQTTLDQTDNEKTIYVNEFNILNDNDSLALRKSWKNFS